MELGTLSHNSSEQGVVRVLDVLGETEIGKLASGHTESAPTVVLGAGIGKVTRAEPRQQVIYDALGISDQPGRTEKTIA